MDRHVIAATLVAMATRRRAKADDLLALAHDAVAAAHATADPKAGAALRASAAGLYGASVTLRLHGWVEEALAEFCYAKDGS